ncbi:MAG: hypothetical protein KDA49_18040 [Rhodospirillaceae bacterium]|nr:hypothetical protein [Rhodospirillaceae bacterium]MCA8934386.1 hypothetical protein [Rhodospirillaceae bacterium]
MSAPATRTLLFVLCALAAAACQSTPRQQATEAADPPAATRPTIAAIAALPAAGAGADLGGPFTGADRTSYQHACAAALSTGQPVGWDGPSGDFGRVAATSDPYLSGGQTCRDFVQSYSHGGRMFTERGTACQGTDGAWARSNRS